MKEIEVRKAATGLDGMGGETRKRSLIPGDGQDDDLRKRSIILGDGKDLFAWFNIQRLNNSRIGDSLVC